MRKADIDSILKEIQSLRKRNQELENLLKKETPGPIPVAQEQIYRSLLHLCPASLIVSSLDDGVIYDVSDRFCRQSGFSREEAIGRSAVELGLWVQPDEARKKFRDLLLRDGQCMDQEFRYQRRNGNVIICLTSAVLIAIEKRRYAIALVMDITARKQAEEALKLFAEDLEEANTALRVLMRGRNEEQKAIEEKLQTNINDLVMPYLKKIGRVIREDPYKQYLSVLESNLREIVSPFMKNFLSLHKSLTPQEIQVADLIRRGKRTKEIADMLNTSASTIGTHRNNIRKKLNLKKEGINLRSYLQSLQ